MITPTGSRVLIGLRVDSSPQRAFDAFTAEIGQWWRPNKLFQFSDRTDGVIAFRLNESGTDGAPARQLIERYPDGTVFVIGNVQEWEPPHRLVVGWRQSSFGPDQDTILRVSFELVSENQTRVTVEHYGWDRIAQDHAARHGFPLEIFQLRFAQWWQSQLRLLSDTLDKGPACRASSS